MTTDGQRPSSIRPDTYFIMQYSITGGVIVGLTILMARPALTMTACSGRAVSNGYDCSGDCENYDISIGQIVDMPGTNCIRNPKNDPGFAGKLCNQAGGGGQQTYITTSGNRGGANYVWDAPNTGSFQRTGN